MNRSVWYRARAGTLLAAVFLVAAVAAAEEATLELKRFESQQNYDAREYRIRATSPQGFHAYWDQGQKRFQQGDRESEETFKRLATKEPEYASPYPFRGVIKLGTQEYVFALDRVDTASESKQDESVEAEAKKPEAADGKPSLLQAIADTLAKAPSWSEPKVPDLTNGYNRLYFDFNHNGDLTDDKPVAGGVGQRNVYDAQTYCNLEFPRIDVAFDADGVAMNGSFFVRGYINASQEWCNVALQFSAGSYREGEITLDGKKRHVYLVDFNSNGRFDDQTTIIKVRRGNNRPEEAYPQYGDMLLIDPENDKSNRISPYEVTSADSRHLISKLVDIDGKFYDVKVTPAGDRLALSPANVEVGSITNPNANFRAVIYGDQGILKFCGTKDAPVAVPVGDWQLLSYTIDVTEQPPAPKASEEKPAASSSSLLEAIGKSVASLLSARATLNRPNFSFVSARALADSKPVKVVQGETVVFPFGPPYTPTVIAQPWGGPAELYLELALVGSVGEMCSDMMVNGERPGKPHFTIKDPQGEVVQQGDFEYG